MDCPFCHTPAKDIQITTYRDGCNKIMCPYCKATFEGMYSKQECIDRWNRR